MAEIAELIERLQKATGPDRALGNDVLLAAGWKIEEKGDGPVRAHLWIDPIPGYGEDFLDGEQPDPTASIDAALTLVPEGCRWALSFSKYVPHVAEVHLPDEQGWLPGECDSNRAIALCIAALKARMVLTNCEGQGALTPREEDDRG